MDTNNTIPKAEESVDSACIMERMQSLQHFADSILEEISEPTPKLFREFQKEVDGINTTINNAFQSLKRMISAIHDGRSQWEKENEGLIQQTGEQLHRVTETTETATNQILDAVEKVISIQTGNSQKVTELLSQLEQNEDLKNSGMLEPLKEIAAEFESEQADTFQIMDYLQFQDITAQQIEKAYRLLTEAEEQLVEMAQTFKGVPLMELVEKKTQGSYYPDTEYMSAEEKQKKIDALFNK